MNANTVVMKNAEEYYNFSLQDYPGRIPFKELEPESHFYWEKHFMEMCRKNNSEVVYAFLTD